MANFQVFKETALPGSLEPHSIYLIAPTTAPADYLEIYVTNAAGSAVRSTLTRGQVQAMVDATVAAATGNATVIVDDISDRDGLTPTNAMRVFVVDASADTTVASGGAEYMWRATPAPGAWIKLSETESQDLVLAWGNITGRPSSTTANIDAAVAQRHTHTNKTQLDKIGEDGTGNFTYGGERPGIEWQSTGW